MSHHWRQQAVLAWALPRLAQGTPVAQVATDSGYASESAFSAMFKARMGNLATALPAGQPQNPGRHNSGMNIVILDDYQDAARKLACAENRTPTLPRSTPTRSRVWAVVGAPARRRRAGAEPRTHHHLPALLKNRRA